jgi:hypothetical protein
MSPASRRGVLGGLAALAAPSGPAFAAKGVHDQHTPAVLASGGRTVSGPSPDAELIALCDRIVPAWDAYVASFGHCYDGWTHAQVLALEAEQDRLQAVVFGMVEEALAIPAATREGILAKARIAFLAADKTDGEVDLTHPPDLATAGLAWSVIEDLVRIAGGGA